MDWWKVRRSRTTGQYYSTVLIQSACHSPQTNAEKEKDEREQLGRRRNFSPLVRTL